MEQDGKPKRKKLQMEIMQLKRDVHKYHTLYEKQKEYCEEKLQELMVLDAKQRELEHKCCTQEKEIERLYLEHVNLVKALEMKNQELEIKKSELNSVINSYQELSKILLLVDKHLQFLETEKLVDSGALNGTAEGSHTNTKNKKSCKLASKFTKEQDCNLPVLDKTILSADDFIAAQETSQNHTTLTSLEIEKERLARLLNHPQMGGTKSENLNVDNKNLNKEAELFLKNSSVIWSTLEGTSANSVSTKDLIDKFKDKLHFCQQNLKKDKENNKTLKEELMKLTDKLQKELDSSQKNLEAHRAKDKALQDHYQGLEKEIEKLQQDLKKKSGDVETRNQALKTLAVQNDKWREQQIKNEKQIRILTEKLKVLEYVNKTRNEMFEQKLKQLMKSGCRNQAKVKSKQVQTDDTQERLTNNASKYQMVLSIQDLLKKLIEKSEEVIKLETILKRKSIIVENIVLQLLQKSNTDRKSDNCNTDKNQPTVYYKSTLSSPTKSHKPETESSSDDDSTLEDVSLISQEPEETPGKMNSLRKSNIDQNESWCKSKMERTLNYSHQRPGNNFHNKYIETDSIHCVKRHDCRQRGGRDELHNKLPQPHTIVTSEDDSGSCQSLIKSSLEMPAQKNMNRTTPCQLSKETNRKEPGQKLNPQSLPELIEESHSAPKKTESSPKKRAVKTGISLLHEMDSSASNAGHRTSTRFSRMALHEDTTSSENDHSDTTEDFVESSEQECNTSNKKLGNEIRKFLKQQNLELDRSQQNNSSNLFKNAEFYVILKGHRKKSS